jgi:hypothetical protein
MRIVSALLITFSSLLIQGCASVDWNNPDSISKRIKLSTDQFTKSTTIRGPEAPSIGDNHNPFDQATLIATKSQGGSFAYAIRVLASPRYEWMFLDHAYDSKGNELNVNVLDRQVSANLLFELLSIPVSYDYLASNQDGGITLEARGTRGRKQFLIPANYIKVFLSATQGVQVSKAN